MKKWLIGILAGAAVCIAVGYIALMAMFEGPIAADVTGRICLSPSEKEIVLPWYMTAGVREWGVREGVDAAGNSYSGFFYELPGIFEDSEMIVIVSWEDQKARLYAGESRAMEIADREFDFVTWGKIETPVPCE